jgi:hypothetical protein
MLSPKQTQNTWTNWTNSSQKNLLSKLLIFLILNSSCGVKSPSQRKTIIDPEFVDLVELFEKEQNENVDIDISFKELDYPTVGLCWWQTRSASRQGIEIEIDPDFWFESSDVKKEELLFHELGHCILNRDHLDEKINYYVPKSIMYPYVFGYAYTKYRSYYVDELKNLDVLLTDYL